MDGIDLGRIDRIKSGVGRVGLQTIYKRPGVKCSVRIYEMNTRRRRERQVAIVSREIVGRKEPCKQNKGVTACQ